jgi:hypothetical protein
MSPLDNVSGPKKPPSLVTYRSPGGLYTVAHPGDWLVEVEDNVVNIRPPDGLGEVTISALHGTPPEADFARKWLADTFENDKPLSELHEVAQNGWTGVRQGFVSAAPDVRAWIGIVATLPPVFVLITANAPPQQFKERGDEYGRILESLRLMVPKAPKSGP